MRSSGCGDGEKADGAAQSAPFCVLSPVRRAPPVRHSHTTQRPLFTLKDGMNRIKSPTDCQPGRQPQSLRWPRQELRGSIAKQLRLLVAFCLLPVAAPAQLAWTTNAGAIVITGYTTNAPGALTIPATITGLPVTEIQSLSGPNLTSVTLGTNITMLNVEAFYNCTALTNATLDNNLLYVGAYAFYGCTALTNVSTLSSNVYYIGNSPFQDCTNLTAINVNPNNLDYASPGGVLFDKALDTLIQYPNGKAGNYTVSNAVTTIQDYAFAYTARLTGINFGTNVNYIGYATFYGCSSLTNFTLPTSLNTIGFDAFGLCASLTSVAIPDSVTSLNAFAFAYCTKLTNATIGSGVSNVGDGSAPFENCSSLPAINVNAANPNLSSPGGVLYDRNQTMIIEYPEAKTVGPYIISNTVTRVASYAFDGCLNLTGITIPNSVTNIGTNAFYYSSITSVTVPNKVLAVGDGAFEFCSELTNVIIGSSVQRIGNYAFYDDYSGPNSLDFMLFMGNPPAYGNGDFTGATLLTRVYYLPGTTGWGSTYDGLPTVMWTLPYPVILSSPLGIKTNKFTFTIAWATNLTVIVQACTNLANPQWLPVQTNALSNDTWTFSDAKWTNSRTRFYRVYYP